MSAPAPAVSSRLASLTSNLEAADKRLFAAWRMVMLAALAIIGVCTAVVLSADAWEATVRLWKVSDQEKATERFRHYTILYLAVGSTKLRKDLRAGTFASYWLSCCPTCKPPGRKESPGFIDKTLRACASWEMFVALLLDKDVTFPVDLWGGGQRVRYQDRDPEDLSQYSGVVLGRNGEGPPIRDDLERAADEAKLTTMPSWKGDVFVALADLSERQLKDRNDLSAFMSERAAGKVQLPIVDKAVDPVIVVWAGGLILMLLVMRFVDAWKQRAKLFSRVEELSDHPLTWERANEMFKVGIPSLLKDRPKSAWAACERVAVKSTNGVVLSAYVAMIVYSFFFPLNIDFGWRMLAVVANCVSALVIIFQLASIKSHILSAITLIDPLID